MAYDLQLAHRVREYLAQRTEYIISEKKMFGGLAFLVNNKMCVNISGSRLMCRFDPSLSEDVSDRKEFSPMYMRGKPFRGYGYVDPAGFQKKKDFDFWMQLCLDFNPRAKISGK